MVPMTIMVTANTTDATRDVNVLQVLPAPAPIVATRQEDSSDHGTMSTDFKNPKPKYFEVDIARLNELFFFKLMSMNKIGKIIPVGYVYGVPNVEICIKLHFRVVAEE
jgi:hypothetical protein